MSSKETREGVTYKTSVDLADSPVDIDVIPPPRFPPSEEVVEKVKATEVFFDLETTGLGKKIENTFFWPERHRGIS